MIKLLNILDELGTPKELFGQGVFHDVYPFKADPTKVIKIAKEKQPLDKYYVRMFLKYPEITAKVFKATPNYMVVEKLDTQKFLEEDKKIRGLFKSENVYYDTILFVDNLLKKYPDTLMTFIKLAEKEGLDDILSRWIDFLKRVENTRLEELDIHNDNLGYDSEGKLKLLDL